MRSGIFKFAPLALVALVSTMLAWLLSGCSDEGAFSIDPQIPSAKAVGSTNPFQGQDESGYIDGIGDASNVEKYLKVLCRQLAALMQDESARIALLDRLHQSDGQVLNLAKMASSDQRILSHLSENFKERMGAQGVTGQLGTQVITGSSDETAVLQVSQALFGLQVALVMPETGTWNRRSAMPVFHNPTTDETETTHFEGINPDGTEVFLGVQIDSAPYPFVYLHSDEEFFQRPENQPIEPGSGEGATGSVSWHEKFDPVGPRHSLLQLLSDWFLPTPVFAKGPTHKSCYHEAKLYIRSITIFDDFEHNLFDKPEIYMYCNLTHKNPGGDWHKKNKPLDFVDKPNYTYNADNEIPVPLEIYDHSGEHCDFYPYFPHPEEDYAVYRVKEWDPWPNPPDKVAKWKDIPSSNNTIHLNYRTSESSNGWNQKANIVVGSW